MASNPITKADFETAYGRPLTDDQYAKLRMGLQMGMLNKGTNAGGAYDHTLPRSTASMPEEQRNAIGRLNWLAAGRPGEPGANMFDAAPGQTQGNAPPKAPSRSDGSKPAAKRADAGDGGPADDRADPVKAPTSVYEGNGQGVKDWQKKAVRPGYGWVEQSDGSLVQSPFADNNGWENGQAPDPAKIVLGPPPGPSAPKPPSPFAATPLPTGNGDIVAAQKKAAVDVAGLEADAANLPPAEGDFAGAQAKAKKDIAALEKDAAKLKPAAQKKGVAAPVPQPIPEAAPPVATAQNWNSAPPAAKQKAWQQASLAAGKSLGAGEFQMQMQNAQQPAPTPPPQPVAMTPAPTGPVATPQAPAGAPSKEQVEATLGKSITDQEYLAYVSKPQYPQYVPVQQPPTLKGLAF